MDLCNLPFSDSKVFGGGGGGGGKEVGLEQPVQIQFRSLDPIEDQLEAGIEAASECWSGGAANCNSSRTTKAIMNTSRGRGRGRGSPARADGVRPQCSILQTQCAAFTSNSRTIRNNGSGWWPETIYKLLMQHRSRSMGPRLGNKQLQLEFTWKPSRVLIRVTPLPADKARWSSLLKEVKYF